MNGEYMSLVASFPKNNYASASIPVMDSFVEETHYLETNLDQNMKQEILFNHQFTCLKINLKCWFLLVHTLECMSSIHYSAYNYHNHSVNLNPQVSLSKTGMFNEIWDGTGFILNKKCYL
jgi:hypothetical protein